MRPTARFVVGFYRDPKMLAAGPMARLLYVQIVTYCVENLTDGCFVRGEFAAISLGISRPNAALNRLVSCGLVERTGHSEWRIPPDVWKRYNYTKAQVTARRAENATRQAAWRAAHASQRDTSVTDDVTRDVTNNVTNNAPYPYPYPYPYPHAAAAAATSPTNAPETSAAAAAAEPVIALAIRVRRAAMGHRVHSPLAFDATLRADYATRADEIAQRLNAGDGVARIVADMTGATMETVYAEMGNR